ncbi:ADP ribosyltransferase [uncultured Caudovirales phage]|uniref:ADP ribosyltransferase n=1 Tax=uncultured Caudovirales phage TaxID=2100421 RepID=A0A6J5R4I8_9CAUD|nr:ADP ribosyltransferase [uncultured Caudovirales phage]CAB4177027.1 ADP ribosyltransferase [uncultured Caudovirales phage]CAB4182206.1 ADP ribosyltransferase [uncultured Caudovirales phage]CAB4190802.1 ADP ribosyltransferase [uncultured Caudovirales phage]CAB4211151.1 ADP ribosyltransferase [uncultured Caudovirales phage]
MKTFKQFAKQKKQEEGTGVIPVPIHFKFVEPVEVEGPKVKGLIPAPIHFKHVQSKKKLDEAAKPATGYKAWLKTDDNTKLGKSHEAISNKLHKSNAFTPEHDSSIRHYTGSKGASGKGWASTNMNKNLIKNKGKIIAKTHQKHVKGLDSAIKNNPIQHDLNAYSGTSFDPRKHLDKKGQMHSPAYISASHSKTVAHSFSQNATEGKGSYEPRHIIHFDLKKGDPATHVSHLSDHTGEHETVIGRNTKLQYHGTESHYDPDREVRFNIHRMSIVRKK